MLKIVLVTIISSAFAMPNQSTEAPTTFETVTAVIKKDCASGIFNPTCLKLGAVSLLEKLNAKEEVALIPGVSLVKDKEAKPESLELARSLSSEPEERLDKYLLYHVSTFLDSHSVKLRLLDDGTVEETKSAIEEGRGRRPGGKRGGMNGMMAIAMMMKGEYS